MERGDHLATGRAAEDRAVAWLEAQGYHIIERNYRERRGEIDIVATEDDVLVFVEVRCRVSSDYGEPEETIGPSKRAALIRTARGYLVVRNRQDAPVRFDVVTVSGEQLERVRLIRNAIEVDDPWR